MEDNKNQLLVFDSHPVQYRVPVWRMIEKMENSFGHIVYASDFSIRGGIDGGFGISVSWDDPMLEGYSYTILNSENTKDKKLSGWNSITGKGVREIIASTKAKAILLTGLNYRYDFTVLFWALIYRIPVVLRCETQDVAFKRNKFKSLLRSAYYRFIYLFINDFLFIGNLNKKHYLSHGVSISKLHPARYCTIDRYSSMNDKKQVSEKFRMEKGISEDKIVVGFSGKFISKKNPVILFEMIRLLPSEIQKRLVLYFIGSGELEPYLQEQAIFARKEYGIDTIFTGFLNQSQIGIHYLLIDIFVLPSQQMGETWGLVVNEGIQAGCNIIMSDSVGSSQDFGELERVAVFKTNDFADLAKAVMKMTTFRRDFYWGAELMKQYSIESTSESIINVIQSY